MYSWDILDELSTLDLIALGVNGILIVFYHIIFVFQLLRNPIRINLGRNFRANRAWVSVMMANEGKGNEILTIQSLRNVIITNTYLSYTSAVISFSAISYAFQAQRDQSNLLGLQVGVIGFIFLISFYNFAMVIRIVMHVGYVLQIKKSVIAEFSVTSGAYRRSKKDAEGEVALHRVLSDRPLDIDMLYDDHIKRIQHMMQRQVIHFWVGMRGIYVSAAFGLWIMGEGWFFVGSVLMVVGWWIHDHN